MMGVITGILSIESLQNIPPAIVGRFRDWSLVTLMTPDGMSALELDWRDILMTLMIGCLHWNPIQPPMFTLPLRAIVGSPTCPQHCRVVCRAHMRGVEEKQIVGIPPIHPGQATAKPTSTSAAFDGHTLKPSYALPIVQRSHYNAMHDAFVLHLLPIIGFNAWYNTMRLIALRMLFTSLSLHFRLGDQIHDGQHNIEINLELCFEVLLCVL